MKNYVVDELNNGSRLDAYIASLDENLSRMAVKKLVEEKLVMVNGQVAKNSYKVKTGDTIEFEEPEEVIVIPAYDFTQEEYEQHLQERRRKELEKPKWREER